MNCGVYIITNTVTGEQYVGSSRNVKRRWYEHMRVLAHGYHYNRNLLESYLKYGKSVFTFEVFVYCSPEELLKCEQTLVNLIDPAYNICKQNVSNRGGVIPSSETRAKLSKSATGRIMSEEAKLKIALAHLGVKEK